jgi:hypothetical protein
MSAVTMATTRTQRATYSWRHLIADWLIGGGAFVFLIALFLSWYTISTNTLDLHATRHVLGWDDWTGKIAFFLALATLVVFVARLIVPDRLPLSPWLLVGGLGIGMLLCAMLDIWRDYLNNPPSDVLAAIGIRAGHDVGWTLAAISACAVILGALLGSAIIPNALDLLRKRGFIGGLVVGGIAVVLVLILLPFFTSNRGLAYQPLSPSTSPGNVTLITSDDALTLGARYALQQAQSQLPFEVKNVVVRTLDGDTVEVAADGSQVIGFTPNMLATLRPVVTSAGTLDFTVKHLSLSGVNLVLGGIVGGIVERALSDYFTQYVAGQVHGFTYKLVSVSTSVEGLVVRAQISL